MDKKIRDIFAIAASSLEDAFRDEEEKYQAMITDLENTNSSLNTKLEYENQQLEQKRQELRAAKSSLVEVKEIQAKLEAHCANM
ncbi:hypothetical protein BDY19DRAFT_975094 [Irpex rosettiformis]|uniref:Uncharacterized protein n=1 Tax=Irpex rosettiformis TaxID=378272 RepID=A0ACB8TPE6_9APHY|nr:hypothetical protein BDY19DRAFT_975094 [Irpex rosettiformis]